MHRLVLLFLLAVCASAAAEPENAVAELRTYLAKNNIQTEVMPKQLPLQIAGTKMVSLTPVGSGLIIMVFVYPTLAEAQHNLPLVSERMSPFGDVIACRNLVIALPWWGDNSNPMKQDMLKAINSFRSGG